MLLSKVKNKINCSMRDLTFFFSIPQLCSVVVIALILLVLLFIAPLFFHLPKVRETFAKIIQSRLSSLFRFGAKFNDVTNRYVVRF